MIKKIFNTIYRLIIPNICISCGEDLQNKNDVICYYCIENLPITNFQNTTNNLVFNTLIKSVKIENACSIYFFQNHNILRNIIHQFKYNSKPELAIKLGEIIGVFLNSSSLYKDVEAIIPIPLHIKKIKFRGYNQSEKLSIGISNTFNKPVINTLINRVKNTKPQASLKTQTERNTNLKNSFNYILKNQNSLKHILLIDDVFTTGSTIISCINEIQSKSTIKISVCTLAFAFN